MTGLVAGPTRLYGIIGEPIAQVRSPAVFNAAFRQSGVDAVLVPLHVPRDGFAETMRGLMRLGNLGGFMITIPHKQATMALVDEIRPRARRVGAINAVRREADGRWVADMFDGLGFVLGLEKSGHKLAGRRLLLVGAGGAGSAIADAAAEAGAAAMTIVDLDRAKAERLAATIAAAYPGVAVTCADAPAPAGHDLVVNATPMGMRPGDPLPIPPDDLTADMLVADVITKPEVSPLLEAARSKGCATQIGRLMAEGQSAAVADFFGLTLDWSGVT